MRTVKLLKNAERRAATGHLWLFSNEIAPSGPAPAPGEDVRVEDARGRLVGTGTWSPASLMAVRLHARGREEPLDADAVRARVRRAWKRRTDWLGEEGARACRVFYAEGDNLPGLVVDRYGDFLCAQFLTVGTEIRRELILDILEETFAPKGILLRNDSPAREHEGLPREIRAGRGEVGTEVLFELHGLTLAADLHGGQKTGFFFDQRENYRLIAPYAPGARVLDAFCYSGAWGLHALAFGAASVDFLDASAGALALARANAERNGFAPRAGFVESDALEHLRKAGPHDLVILDPPAFVKSRKRVPEALKGYLNLNKWGMRAVRPGGRLVTCSCSHHVRPEVFVETVALAAREAGREARVLGTGGQGPDHPWVPAMPETSYLKVLLLEVW